MLRRPGGDTFSYEGPITAAMINGFPGPVNLVNGNAFTTADPATVPGSLARALDGGDTGMDDQDWFLSGTPTPGLANGPDPGYAGCCGNQDYNGDGDFGTDADIEAFFACLAGSCCGTCWPGGQDFNGDGDFGTDADIEAFFRVLAGGAC